MNERLAQDFRSKKNRTNLASPKHTAYKEDFELDDVTAKLTDNVLHRIEHVLHRDEKIKPKGREQKLKLASHHHNFSPLVNFPLADGSLLTFPKSKNRIKKVAEWISDVDKGRADLKLQQHSIRKIRSEDRSPEAKKLREQAEMPYHKAHKVSIPLNPEEASDEKAKGKIKKLRKLLFINQKEEGIKTGFMANIFAEEGEKIKELVRFISGVETKDLKIFYYGKSDDGKELHPTFLGFTNEKELAKNGLTNQDVAKITDPGGKQRLSEVPIVQVRSPSGKILLEITCSHPKWKDAHPNFPNNLNGSWAEGQVNFYHRQKKLKRKQTEQIFNRLLENS